MNTLNTSNIIFFDLETTGLSPIHDYTLQLSAVILPKTGIKDINTPISFDEYINPPKDIIIKNSDIHGITRDVLKDASSFDVVYTMFYDWINSQFGDDKVYLVAHNCFSFDMRFLEVECKRNGLTIPENWIFIDSLVQFRKYNPDIECENYKLVTLYEWLKDETTCIEGKLHNSLTDVKVLMFVYLKLSSKFTQKQIDSILKEGKCSIQYSPAYLELPISKLMTFDKSHIALFKKYNINTIGSLSIVYSNEIKKAQQDEPIDKPFYQFLSQMSISFIMRRELTSKIKYIMYMCS